MELLTTEEQGKVCGVVQRGCDYETAVKLVGRTLGELRYTLLASAEFASDLAKSEAACEFRHMENVQQAAEETKNWRASVWWLEHRLPERFASRKPGALTTTELQGLLGDLAAGLAEDIESEDDRVRVVRRIEELAHHWGESLRLESPTAGEDEQTREQS